MKNLSKPQQRVVDFLDESPTHYLQFSPNSYDFQQFCPTPAFDPKKGRYYKLPTHEALVRYGIIAEFEPGKFRLAPSPSL